VSGPVLCVDGRLTAAGLVIPEEERADMSRVECEEERAYRPRRTKSARLGSMPMLRRPIVIVILTVICINACIVWQSYRPIPGIEAQGEDKSLVVAWLALATAVVTLLGTLVGLVQKLVELRARR
jgi:hypothetical protein